MRRYTLLLVDVALIIISTLFAMALRDDFDILRERLDSALPYLAATALLSVIAIPAARLNSSIWRYSGMHDYLRIAVTLTVISVGAVSLSFVYHRLDGVSRSLPILQVLVGTALLVGTRVTHRLIHARRHERKGAMAHQSIPAKAAELTVLVLGVTRLTEAYVQALSEFAPGRVSVAGLMCLADRHVGRLVCRYPVLGVANDVERIIDKLEVHGVHVDRIVIAAPFESLPSATREALIRVERFRSISLQSLTGIVELEAEGDGDLRPTVSSQSASPAELRFEMSREEIELLSSRKFWKLKRIFDIVSALLGLIIFAPIFFLVGISVGASVGFPVVFWQRRPGLYGRTFHLYKFRTMRAAHTSDGLLLSDSERVSRLGIFLRRTRLDELPQLFNILRGDMSFVGPRPLLLRDQPSEFGARLLVRPGLTGWAQVVGGRDIPLEDKAVLDVWYVRNASVLLDLKVWLRTIPIVLFGERISRSLIESAWKDLIELGIAKADFAPELRNGLHLAKSKL